jgi:hypothetical protein
MHDPLTFEARLADAYARYVAEAPTEFDAVAITRHAIETRARVAPSGLGLSIGRSMRLVLIAGLLVAAAIAVAALAGRLNLLTPRPSDSPAPSPVASGPLPAASPTVEPAAAMPREVWGDWLADVGEIPGLPAADPRIQLSLTWQDGLTEWVQINGAGVQVLHSTSIVAAAGEIRLRASDALSGCSLGDEGRYGWSRSADGLILALTPLDDACALRATTLGRTWTRSLGAVNDGRRGIVNYFDPAIEITLPEGVWAAGGADRSADMRGPNGLELIAIQDPRGFAEPCSPSGGAPIAVATGADAFVAYMRGLPGVTITTAERQIDGLRAVHLRIETSSGSACPGGLLWKFQSPDVTAPAGWSITAGDSDSIWLVDVSAHTYLLQYLGSDLSEADELDVLATAHLVQTLPTS